MKRSNLIFIELIAIWLTSCMVGQKVQYDKLAANIEVQGTKSVSIAVLDNRVHILKDGKPQSFVGYLRGAYGNPFLLVTKSSGPLADDIASSINETLSQKGFKCSVVATVPTDGEKAVVDKLKSKGSEISILFLMNSWWTDTYMTTLLNYDVTISVYDKNGIQLATKNFKESKKGLGVNIIGTEYRKKVPAGFKTELEKMFNDADIKKSLQ